MNSIENFCMFYNIFLLWYKENKPHGFDTQDLRLGGLSRRLRSCRERLESYVSGEENTIPELDEKLLDFFGGGDIFEKEKTPTFNTWTTNASVNIV